jgi:hypothetical protein
LNVDHEVAFSLDVEFFEDYLELNLMLAFPVDPLLWVRLGLVNYLKFLASTPIPYCLGGRFTIFLVEPLIGFDNSAFTLG